MWDMKIGELSKQSGLSRDTIRFYERHNLISSKPSSSATNTYKDYPSECIERLAMIGEAQDAGFSISELVELIGNMEKMASISFEADIYLQAKIDEIEVRIQRAQRFSNLLKQTKNALSVTKSGSVNISDWRSSKLSRKFTSH